MKNCKLELVKIEENGYHILVEVQLNGQNAIMVLDTGASKSVIDLEWSRKNLKAEIALEEETSVGVGGSQLTSYSATVDSLFIGDLQINQLPMALIDLSHVKLSYEKLQLPEITGIIGGDILNRFNAVIDYKNLIVCFD